MIGQFVRQNVVIGQFPKPIVMVLTSELQQDIQTFVCFKHLQSWRMSSTNHQYLNHQVGLRPLVRLVLLAAVFLFPLHS